jgi:hypothetical protein
MELMILSFLHEFYKKSHISEYLEKMTKKLGIKEKTAYITEKYENKIMKIKSIHKIRINV